MNRGYLANMARFIVPVLAIVAAIVAAGLLGIVAHYVLGIARGTIPCQRRLDWSGLGRRRLAETK